MERASQGGGFFHNEEELFAAIEQAMGREAAEIARRSMERDRNPLPLTDAERAELRANLEPILRDMRSSGAIVPNILEEVHEDLEPDWVGACVQEPNAVGPPWTIRFQVSAPLPERLAGLAEQLQEWEIEELAAAGRPATWPECPLHPDSHPLAPQTSGDQAVWCCPRSGQVISAIGALPPR